LAKAPKFLLSIFSLLLLLFYFRGNTLVQSFLSTFQCSDFSMSTAHKRDLSFMKKNPKGLGMAGISLITREQEAMFFTGV
jgi:hypothetical protein